MESHDDMKELLVAIAGALDSWSRIEWALEDLFVEISGSDPSRSSIIMASIVSLDARLLVCHNLIEHGDFTDELKDQWKALRKRIRRKSAKRNELAHFSIHDNYSEGVALVPYFSIGRMKIGRAGDIEDLPHLRASEITRRDAEFNDVAQAVWRFVTQVRDRAGQP